MRKLEIGGSRRRQASKAPSSGNDCRTKDYHEKELGRQAANDRSDVESTGSGIVRFTDSEARMVATKAERSESGRHGGGPSRVDMHNDPITNALCGRGDGCATAFDYFSDNPLRVRTGKGGSASVRISAPPSLDPANAEERDYRLTEATRFWLDALYTLAFEGRREHIDGSDLLRLVGYANPLAASMAATMEEAAFELRKATELQLEIDTSDERRPGKPDDPEGRVPIVDADISYRKRSDGSLIDFTVNLRREPSKALPLAAFARTRRMVVPVETDILSFDSVRCNVADRRMWRYVMRRAGSLKMSDRICLDTMWRDLGLTVPERAEARTIERNGGTPADEDAVRKRRARAFGKLSRMLNEKLADGTLDSWSIEQGGEAIVVRLAGKKGSHKAKRAPETCAEAANNPTETANNSAGCANNPAGCANNPDWISTSPHVKRIEL